MITSKVLVWGAGGHAIVVADILRLLPGCEIAGFIDDVNPDRRGEPLMGTRVLGGREVLEQVRTNGVSQAIVAVGDCSARVALAEQIRRAGFQLRTAIHPSAVIGTGVTIKDGTVVVAGAVINARSVIGENVIINTQVCVDHDCVIDDGAHICPGVRLGGHVRVGRGTWVGIGSTVSDHITIGHGTLIGAGSLVLRDVPNGVVAYGTPSKIIRENRPR